MGRFPRHCAGRAILQGPACAQTSRPRGSCNGALQANRRPKGSLSLTQKDLWQKKCGITSHSVLDQNGMQQFLLLSQLRSCQQQRYIEPADAIPRRSSNPENLRFFLSCYKSIKKSSKYRIFPHVLTIIPLFLDIYLCRRNYVRFKARRTGTRIDR